MARRRQEEEQNVQFELKVELLIEDQDQYQRLDLMVHQALFLLCSIDKILRQTKASRDLALIVHRSKFTNFIHQ